MKRREVAVFTTRRVLLILIGFSLAAAWSARGRAGEESDAAERGSIRHAAEIHQIAEVIRRSGAAAEQQGSARRQAGDDVAELHQILQAIVVQGRLGRSSSQQVQNLEQCTNRLATHVDGLASDRHPPSDTTMAALRAQAARLRQRVAAVAAAPDGPPRRKLATALLQELHGPPTLSQPAFRTFRVPASRPGFPPNPPGATAAPAQQGSRGE